MEIIQDIGTKVSIILGILGIALIGVFLNHIISLLFDCIIRKCTNLEVTPVSKLFTGRKTIKSFKWGNYVLDYSTIGSRKYYRTWYCWSTYCLQNLFASNLWLTFSRVC